MAQPLPAAIAPLEAFVLKSFGRRTAPDGSLARDNFLRWFAASQATTHDGCPRVLYHGTAAVFDAFDPLMTGSAHLDHEEGPAFFFTHDRKAARWYAKGEGNGSTGSARGFVLPVFLRLLNPLVVRYGGAEADYLGEDLQKARALGHDGVIAYDIDDGGVQDQYIAFEPWQIKLAKGNCGAFDLADPTMMDRAALLRANAGNALAQTPARRKARP